MKKLNLRYVAQVEIDDSFTMLDKDVPSNEQINRILNELNNDLSELIRDNLSANGSVKITDQLKDIVVTECDDGD